MNFEDRVNELLKKDGFNVYDLVEVVSLLRCENGCPWDKVQTHESLKKDFVEETYEVLDAIDCKSADMLREELGDVLLQVVFHTDIEKDKGGFDLDDVSDEVCKKLILRHPHVFGDVEADTVDKVLSNWDSIKKQEKQQTDLDTLQSVPKSFPALMRAQKLGKRASRAGVDFDSTDKILDEIKRLVSELEFADDFEENAGKKIALLLLLSANLARLCGFDAEELLRDECDGFIARFEKLEKSDSMKELVKRLYIDED